MRKVSGMFVLYMALSACLLFADSAFASSLRFDDLMVLDTGLEVVEPLKADAGTLASPDTVRLRIPATLSSFNFSVATVGEGFPAGSVCLLDWGGEVGAPANNYVTCQGQKFTSTQIFNVSKASLGIGNGGQTTLLYRLEAVQQNYGADDLDAERYLSVTFIADGTSRPYIVLDPIRLEGNINLDFTKEIGISASTGGTLSNLRLSENTWNGLTLKLSQTDGKITITGRPKIADTATFTVSGSIDGVAVAGSTFTISVSGASVYALKASPSRVTFTTDADAVSYVDITSSSGADPTGLAVDITSWNGLEIDVSNSSRRVTVSGTPDNRGSQTITISGKANDLDAIPATFMIEVVDSGDEDDSGGGSCNAGLSVWAVLALVPLFVRGRR